MATFIKFPITTFEPLQLIELTTAERAIINLVFDGKALKNPVRPSITKALDSINREIGLLTPLAGGTGNQVIPTKFGFPAPPVPGGLSDTNITSLITALNSLKSKITAYRTHSDRVSGFTLPTGTDPPSFPGLLGVAVAHNLIKNSLNPLGTPTQDHFSFIFKTLLGSAEDLMERTLAATFQIFERINGNFNDQVTLIVAPGAGNYTVSETAKDLTTLATATIIDWKPSTNTLKIRGADPGDFNSGEFVQGLTSLTTRSIVSVTFPTFDQANPASTPFSVFTAILAAINALVGPINTLPSIDNDNYVQALELITKFGLAQMISSLAENNEFARFLFNNVNGTNSLNEQIENLLAEQEEAPALQSLSLIGPEG